MQVLQRRRARQGDMDGYRRGHARFRAQANELQSEFWRYVGDNHEPMLAL